MNEKKKRKRIKKKQYRVNRKSLILAPGHQHPEHLTSNSDSTQKIIPRTSWNRLESEI